MKRRLFTGAVAAICVVAGVVSVTAWREGEDDRTTARSGYCAVLPDTIGLYAGNDVTRMGYGIGKITSITPSESGVRVEFSLNSGRSVPADAKAVTRSKSILADRSLELVGDGTGPRLEPGACIAIDNAYTPKSISEITGSAADLIDQIAPNGDTRAVEGAINAMSGAVSGVGPSVATLMATASRAAESPDRWVSDIGSIIQAMAPLSGDALTRWDDVASIVTKLPDATDEGARVLWPGAVHMIYGMTPVLQLIADLVPKYATDIYAVLDSAPGSIHVAATRVGDLERAFGVLPALANTAALVVGKGHGAAVQVAPPWIRVGTPDSTQLCNQINAAHAGACVAEVGSSRVARLGALDLLMAGVR